MNKTLSAVTAELIMHTKLYLPECPPNLLYERSMYPALPAPASTSTSASAAATASSAPASTSALRA
jgi:hypothetical protein